MQTMTDTTSRALDVGRSAAHTLADTAETLTRRVRERDWTGALADARRIVQERPGVALIAAVVLGFFLKRALSAR